MNRRAIFARVLLVALVAALAAAAAYALSRGEKPQYEASTQVLFESYASPELAVLGNGFLVGGSDADRRLASNIEILRSNDIAVRAAKDAPQLGMPPGQIHANVQIKGTGSSDVLTITGRADSPLKARLLVLEYRKAFKKMRREAEQRRARAAVRVLQQELVILPAPQQAGVRGGIIRSQIAQLGVIAKLGSGLPKVVEGVTGGGSKVAPATQRNVLFGLLFGLLIGVGLVALRSEALRQRATGSVVREQRDVRSDWD
jgi:uncharacterized protein involved in exopolysaccharide biosynthesis